MKKQKTPETVTIIVCGPPSHLKGKICSSCRAAAAKTTCVEPLEGRKAGSTCGRLLCLGCAEYDRCPPHARAEARRRAEVRWDPTIPTSPPPLVRKRRSPPPPVEGDLVLDEVPDPDELSAEDVVPTYERRLL